MKQAQSRSGICLSATSTDKEDPSLKGTFLECFEVTVMSGDKAQSIAVPGLTQGLTQKQPTYYGNFLWQH